MHTTILLVYRNKINFMHLIISIHSATSMLYLTVLDQLGEPVTGAPSILLER